MSLGGVNNRPDFSNRKLPEPSAGEAAGAKAAETAAAKLQEAAKLEEVKGDFVDGIVERQAADPATVDGARSRALSGDAEAKARLFQAKDEGTGTGPRRGLRSDGEWLEARASGGSTKPVPRPPPKPPGSTKLVENTPPPGTVDPNKPQLA